MVTHVCYLIKRAKLPKPNITKNERTSLQKLQKDDKFAILPADKGRSTVLMNTTEYKEKMEALVGAESTYTKLNKDPTNRYKNKLVGTLGRWKREKQISDNLYPDSEEPPKLYGTPKEHLNLDQPTGVGEHCLATEHFVSKNNITVLSREQEWHRRKVKEAIYIKQQGPTMNRDQRYQLPPIYTQILPPVSGSSHRYA